MIVHTYVTVGGKDLIQAFFSSLPKEERAEALFILEQLESGSISDLNRLDIKYIENKVWEIRFRRHNRIFYVLKDAENIHLLHACKKQKNATQNKDKQLALKRAKEIT